MAKKSNSPLRQLFKGFTEVNNKTQNYQPSKEFHYKARPKAKKIDEKKILIERLSNDLKQIVQNEQQKDVEIIPEEKPKKKIYQYVRFWIAAALGVFCLIPENVRVDLAVKYFPNVLNMSSELSPELKKVEKLVNEGYSKQEVIEVLSIDYDSIEKTLKQVKIDWNQVALTRAKNLLKTEDLSKDHLYIKLLMCKFEPKQARFAVDHLKDD